MIRLSIDSRHVLPCVGSCACCAFHTSGPRTEVRKTTNHDSTARREPEHTYLSCCPLMSCRRPPDVFVEHVDMCWFMIHPFLYPIWESFVNTQVK